MLSEGNGAVNEAEKMSPIRSVRAYSDLLIPYLIKQTGNDFIEGLSVLQLIRD